MTRLLLALAPHRLANHSLVAPPVEAKNPRAQPSPPSHDTRRNPCGRCLSTADWSGFSRVPPLVQPRISAESPWADGYGPAPLQISSSNQFRVQFPHAAEDLLQGFSYAKHENVPPVPRYPHQMVLGLVRHIDLSIELHHRPSEHQASTRRLLAHPHPPRWRPPAQVTEPPKLLMIPAAWCKPHATNNSLTSWREN